MPRVLTFWLTAVLVLAVLATTAVLFLRPKDSGSYDSRKAACQSNLKHLAQALHLYADDWGGQLPDPSQWETRLAGIVKETYFCPAAETRPGYAYYKALPQKIDTLSDPEAWPLWFDSGADGPNPVAGLETFAPRHRGVGNIVYLDGHVRAVRQAPAGPGVK